MNQSINHRQICHAPLLTVGTDTTVHQKRGYYGNQSGPMSWQRRCDFKSLLIIVARIFTNGRR